MVFDATRRTERVTNFGREVAFFRGDPEAEVFCVFHVPRSPQGGGLVVCQSILGDFIPNYRREVVLARQLAGEGVAVARFHYRGFGQSSGTPLEATFESMCADAIGVAEHFTEALGVERLSLLGTRWGALVAAAVAAGHPGAPMALWEPALSARLFFREGFRAQRMSAVAARGATPGPEAELADSGVADVLGYSLGKALYEGAQGLELTELLAPATGPLLFVGGGPSGQLGKRDLAAVEALRNAGLSVDIVSSQGPDGWWFIDEDNQTSLEAASRTAQWLSAQLQAGK